PARALRAPLRAPAPGRDGDRGGQEPPRGARHGAGPVVGQDGVHRRPGSERRGRRPRGGPVTCPCCRRPSVGTCAGCGRAYAAEATCVCFCETHRPTDAAEWAYTREERLGIMTEAG